MLQQCVQAAFQNVWKIPWLLSKTSPETFLFQMSGCPTSSKSHGEGMTEVKSTNYLSNPYIK